MSPTASPGKQLNLANLCHVDRGKIQLAFDHALRQIIADVVARHGDKGKRILNMKVTATPEIAQNGALDTINFDFEIKQTVPTRRNPQPYKMLPMRDHTVTFQPNAPGDPRQGSFFDDVDQLGVTGELPDGTKVNVTTGEVADENEDNDGGEEVSDL